MSVAPRRGRAASRQLVLVELAWQESALCRDADDVFFDDAGRRAKAFCNLCPVWLPCLRYGLREEHGVWGGLTPGERTRLQRLRERLARAPADPQNAKDVKRLTIHAGLTVERLAVALGVDPASLEVYVPARAQATPA